MWGPFGGSSKTTFRKAYGCAILLMMFLGLLLKGRPRGKHPFGRTTPNCPTWVLKTRGSLTKCVVFLKVSLSNGPKSQRGRSPKSLVPLKVSPFRRLKAKRGRSPKRRATNPGRIPRGVAVAAKEETFEFVGREIPLNPRFGVRKPSARNAKISVPCEVSVGGPKHSSGLPKGSRNTKKRQKTALAGCEEKKKLKPLRASICGINRGFPSSRWPSERGVVWWSHLHMAVGPNHWDQVHHPVWSILALGVRFGF